MTVRTLLFRAKGYQECLDQSIDSFATSGPGGFAPGEPELYGL